MGRKGQSGGRSDPGWRYCRELEMDEHHKGKGYVYVECNFCSMKITGGVKRLKDHLAKTRKNVRACPSVPIEVQQEMKMFMDSKGNEKRRRFEEMEEVCRVGMQGPSGGDENEPAQRAPTDSSGIKPARGPMDFFIAHGGRGAGSSDPPAQQVTLNASWKKDERRRICRSIGRFFFENSLAFNIANSPSYLAMMTDVYGYGRGFKPPTMHELRTWILKEEKQAITTLVDEAKASWIATGCSIMSDGWTDTKGRTLINFLVNNPKGTYFLKSIDASDQVKDARMLFKVLDEVVEEVGETNVVQVITDNASAYKAAGQMLMDKRKNLYWTPCAAHCIDLMLEDILKLPLHASVFKKAKKIINFVYAHAWVLAMVRKIAGCDLVKPAVTRFATAFLTLQSLIRAKDSLESFFTSRAWKNSSYVNRPLGQSVVNIVVKSKSFWHGVAYVLNTTKPLVTVLRLVDSEKFPPMGFIYEAMDRAKEEIARNLENDETKYKVIWDIVDSRWDRQLHRPLHAAAYFLNPHFHYEPTFSNHLEVKMGLFSCMERLIIDPDARMKADSQLDSFMHARGFFGWANAVNSRKTRSPADWWTLFGDETPELAAFAIRVLSLTCSASGCERNWSSFNQVASEKGLFSLAINLQVPGSMHYSMVFYFVMRELPQGSLLQRFVDGDDEFRNNRLKLIPSVPKGSWIVRQSVGSTPCLLGKAVDCTYIRGPKYLEVDVDIGSSTVANGVLGLVFGVITTLVVDMAFLVQGNTYDELPERLIGAVRVSHIELKTAIDPGFEGSSSSESAQ